MRISEVSEGARETRLSGYETVLSPAGRLQLIVWTTTYQKTLHVCCKKNSFLPQKILTYSAALISGLSLSGGSSGVEFIRQTSAAEVLENFAPSQPIGGNHRTGTG